MRLLESHNDDIILREFPNDRIPPYTILSHTWSEDNNDEVSYKDIKEGTGQVKSGYRKLEFCRNQTLQDGFRYFWIDTCCIDKSDLKELSKAINSMFRWYRDAQKCYVYLADISMTEQELHCTSEHWRSCFAKCRWFKRGWTLQELLAPEIVEFFSRDCRLLGDKKSLENEITGITGISREALQGRTLQTFSTEQRFRWAESRQTTEEEDQTYCLLGLFNVSMSLVYGEGRAEARKRLEKKLEAPKSRDLQVLDWISSSNFVLQQQDIVNRRTPNTGEWFIDSPVFLKWVATSKQTLLCPGFPGAGKTMMAAIAIDHLQGLSQQPDVGVAFVFCKYNDNSIQTTIDLLGAMLKQFALENQQGTQYLHRLHQEHSKKQTRPSLDQIFDVLQSVCMLYTRAFIIVDALDECANTNDGRHLLLRRLSDLQQRTSLNLMFTSRFIAGIEEIFDSALKLEVRASKQDVEYYVKHQVRTMPRCVQKNEALQTEVQAKIAESVDGMFLLARFYVESLQDKTTAKKVQLAIREFGGSDALDNSYDQAVERIDHQLKGHRELARQVLSWLTYAQRPMTTDELCHALAIRVGDQELDETNIEDVQDIVSVCAGLITIEEGSGVIRLVHYTTQEYLERKRSEWLPKAKKEIASTCLAYLSLHEFRARSCSSDDAFVQRLQKYVFLNYAAHYWGSHLYSVQEEVDHNLILSFVKNESLVTACAQALFTDRKSRKKVDGKTWSQAYPANITGLHLAARFGLHLFIKRLITQQNVDVDVKDGHGQAPLSWAVHNGHEEVVKLLLAREDVNADSKDIHERTPLLLAARQGHEAVVKLLLARKDVNADSKDKHYGQTPLSWAARQGHEAVVRLMLARDDVNADSKDKYYGQTPLLWAARNGHEAVVKLLVARNDVNADSEDKYGQTPLLLAARNGHEAVIKLLLARKDVNAVSEDKYGQTPLSWAARNGHDAVVKLLSSR